MDIHKKCRNDVNNRETEEDDDSTAETVVSDFWLVALGNNLIPDEICYVIIKYDMLILFGQCIFEAFLLIPLYPFKQVQ